MEYISDVDSHGACSRTASLKRLASEVGAVRREAGGPKVQHLDQVIRVEI